MNRRFVALIPGVAAVALLIGATGCPQTPTKQTVIAKDTIDLPPEQQPKIAGAPGGGKDAVKQNKTAD